MLSGFSGHLVSESFLEQLLIETPGTTALRAARGDLARWRSACQALGPASSLRALLEVGAEPFVRVLGFSGIRQVEASKGAIAATLSGAAEPVALVVAGWDDRLDGLWRIALVHGRRVGASWCLLFNGTHARLIGTRRVYSRRYAELDLDIAADDERTLAALWTLMHAGAFAGRGGRGSVLDDLVDTSEQYAVAVCRSLRDGVLEASAHILGALIGGAEKSWPGAPARGSRSRTVIDGTFEQALTIVYRILFLLFAEARGLVPLWHPVYRKSYSVEALRAEAEREQGSPGLWDALRAVCRLAHAGCRAGDLRVTPFNGRLFAPSRTPLVERRALDDEAARRAVLALSTRPAADRAGREPIAYRDLGVEQLGAVYETLLDYEPQIVEAPRPSRHASGATVSLKAGSGLRKGSGAFYTPQPIAHYLVRRTLEPLVREAAPDRILELRVLDPAMGSGAFLVAACGYLAHAYEAALFRSGGCHPSDVGPQEHAAIRRVIAERCLYGVDLNPMAVQLARLSLWLATLSADRPLSFLDHHLQVGDSLLGAWVASLRRPPEPRRPRAAPTEMLPLFEEAAIGDAVRGAMPVRFTLASGPSDTLEHVREKERALAKLGSRDAALSKWKRIADLWCARWFSTDGEVPAAAFAALSDAILTGRGALPKSTAERYLGESEAIASARRFFHWELEFPEVFFDAGGERLAAPGFDAVIGNPPWDMIRADAGSAANRARARIDIGSTLRFTREAGVYSCRPAGHANRYQLFVERVITLTRAGGRFGLVLPSGAATDHGGGSLRRLLFSRCAVDAVVGFDNRQGVFPIHRGVRFLLMSATGGAPTTEIGCRLGEHSPAVLDTGGDEAGTSGPWFPVSVTPALLERLSGDGLAIPDLRSPIDVAVAERAAALFPALGDERGWAARFGRELNATDDRACFMPAGHGLPVVQGRQIDPFHADIEAATCSISAREAQRRLASRHLRPRLAYRDVASPTNRVTLIAALLPAGCVSTHTVFCLRTRLALRAQHFLCGLFNSFILNYLARLRVTTHVTTAIVEQLPVPCEAHAPAAFSEIAAIARQLGRRRDPAAFARLNARVAEIYQLTREELRHVLGTFPLVPAEERDGALREFVEQRRHGSAP